MAHKSLATMKKFGHCVCIGGLLKAELVRHEDSSRHILATLCDQHKGNFADRSLENLRATGLNVETAQGKAREPEDT